ncbi:hypothetical protein HK405_012005, partial [Cladochytrium tenue]
MEKPAASGSPSPAVAAGAPATMSRPQPRQAIGGDESGMDGALVAQKRVRDEWMDQPVLDLFGALGGGASQTQRAARQLERDKERERSEAVGRERELNPYFAGGGAGLPPSSDSPAGSAVGGGEARRPEFGDAGSSWRMIKLKRVQDIAEREGRPVEDVALDRYGSMEEFQEALRERRFLDSRHGKRDDRRRDEGTGSRRHETFVSRSEFRRPPGSTHDRSGPTVKGGRKEENFDQFGRDVERKSQLERAPSTLEKPAVYIPAAVIPSSAPPLPGEELSMEELNKLQAKLLKAKMLGLPEDPEIVARIERATLVTTNKRKPNARETHDATGNRVKLLDDHNSSVQDLVLEERMGHGRDYDSDMAKRIATDTSFRGDLEYIDDNADRLARQSAANYKRATAAQEKCAYCWQDGGAPRCQVVALGTQCYLGLPATVPLVEDHCVIVPVQHVLTTLELEDDAWDEIANFMKCLIRMQWGRNHGVLFFEQVVNFRWHRHTVIECVPVPMDKFEDAPAYFREALNAAGEEWSQHRKIIDTAKHGFRRSMVKNLPYFHVWFEPKRGFGHVIEDSSSWEE